MERLILKTVLLLVVLKSARMECGDQYAGKHGPEKIQQWHAVSWDSLDEVTAAMLYSSNSNSAFVSIGAVNDRGAFRNLNGLLPLRRTRSCVGTESNLSQCPQVVSDNVETTCDQADNVYIVCQGIIIILYNKLH